MRLKKLTALVLSCALLASAMPATPSSAFSDISSSAESAAAESLRTLGIVASVENFNPANNLSRAEFCKMAVLSAGFNEESLYSSYTLYPDVPSWQWYAPYINAAIGKYKMIQGYPNGNFGPSDTITYGQATTILLRLLGYETKDIGAFWPRDYIKKAQDIGLANGLTIPDAYGAISRGQAAILLRNLLSANTKDGAQFISTGFSAGKTAVLCATDNTDPALDRGKLSFVDIASGTKDTVTNPGTITDSLIGIRGTMVFSKTDSSKLVGFIADSRAPQKVTVKTVTSEYIETTTGKVTIPRTAKAFVYGAIADYTVCWYDIKPEAEVFIYTDTSGNIDFVSARQSSGLTGTFVYGADGDAIPANAVLELNGSRITVAQLEPYDVISYVPQDNIYRVSDNRISATYESSGPTYNNPTFIVASGQTYAISERAAKYFKDLNFSKMITLLFDASGNVAAAFPSTTVSGATVGVLTDLGSVSAPKAVIEPISGKQITGTPDFAGHTTEVVNQQTVSTLFRHEGSLVSVTPTSDGLLKITPVALSTSLAGKYDKLTAKLGTRDVSAQVKIYERPAPGMPLRKLSLSDLPATLPASRVLHAETDRSGKIGLMVLNNVTGDGFNYGLIKQSEELIVVDGGIGEDSKSSRKEYTLTLKSSKGSATTTSFYSVGAATTALVPGGIATGIDTLEVKYSTPGSVLNSSGTVARDDFDTNRGVRIGNIYVPVAEGVQVYNKQLDRFMTLSEARANFTSFQIFCDSDPYSGGTVRVIIAK